MAATPQKRETGSSRETGAAAGAASLDDLAAALGGDTRTETVAALANKLGGLIGTLRHLFNTAVCGPSWICCNSKGAWVSGTAKPASCRSPGRAAAYKM